MPAFSTPPQNTRFGFHYFPDTQHYRESDLAAWLPELQSLRASWLTLIAPPDRAIPEGFIRRLIEQGIEPVLHFHLGPGGSAPAGDMRLLLSMYARWGVHYAAFFDRPNTRQAWMPSAWAQGSLVERFLDAFLPLAETAVQAGMTPVFPPLEPGGDYWDTAFLRLALESIQRRNYAWLLDVLVIGAYAWPGNRPLNWGAGGPENWPGARPYETPLFSQDQRGFRIFDWYLAISQAAVSRRLPLLLLAAGLRPGDQFDSTVPAVDGATHAVKNIALASSMLDAAANQPGPSAIEATPKEVLACNFWVLAAAPGSPYERHAWFRTDGQNLPVVGAMKQWLSGINLNAEPAPSAKGSSHTIAHYLLLPSYEGGVPDWHLDAVRPFIKKHRPTTGFSLQEAALAARVTVIGGPPSFTDEDIEMLRQAGCQVRQIGGDGTQIATQLEE